MRAFSLNDPAVRDVNLPQEVVREIFGLPDFVGYAAGDEISEVTRVTHHWLRWVGAISPTCPACGSTRFHKHGMRERVVTDTPMGGRPVKLHLSFPRMVCKDCGATWSPGGFPGVNVKHKLTERAYRSLAQDCLIHSLRDVATRMGLKHKMVGDAFSDFLEDYRDRIRFRTPAFMGIDEIMLGRLGQITVITDLEHRTVYDLLNGRNQAALTEYFNAMPGRDEVLWVCTDMYRPFQKSIATAMSNASWAIDHFHVVMKANEAVDDVRKQIQSTVEKSDRLRLKKGLAYPLKRRMANLNDWEAEQIAGLRDNPLYVPLAVAYDLKEEFFDIYDRNVGMKEAAMCAFKEWRNAIPDDPMFRKFRDLARTVDNFYEQIFAVWDCPIAISNGFTEATNRQIRQSYLQGRGTSFDLIRGRALYRATNFERLIASQGLEVGPLLDDVFEEEEAPSPIIDPRTGILVDYNTGEVLA